MSGSEGASVAKEWILVHEIDQSMKAKELGLKVLVRVSAINVVRERTEWTTLEVGGNYLHVKEMFNELTEAIETAEGDEGGRAGHEDI